MQEKQGVATQVLYQLYISLREKKAQIRGIMQLTANAGLHKERDIRSDGVCVIYECSFRSLSQNIDYFLWKTELSFYVAATCGSDVWCWAEAEENC